MTIGFTFGIEPLLVTEADLFAHLAQGNVKSAPGLFIGKVPDNLKSFGLEMGDKIVTIDDKAITDESQAGIFEKGGAKKDIDLTLVSAKGVYKKIHVPLTGKDKSFGIDLKPFTQFPRLAILEIKKLSKSSKAGFKKGDQILQMNGVEIYTPQDFDYALSRSQNIAFTILRDNQILKFRLLS